MNKLRKPSLVARRVIKDFDICVDPERKRFYRLLDQKMVALDRDYVEEKITRVMSSEFNGAGGAIDFAVAKKIADLVRRIAPVHDGDQVLAMHKLVKPGVLARWMIRNHGIHVSPDKKHFYWIVDGKMMPIHRDYLDQKIMVMMGIESRTAIVNDALRQIRFLAPVYHDVTDLSKNDNFASGGRRLRSKPDPNNAMSVAKWMEQDHNKSRVRYRQT